MRKPAQRLQRPWSREEVALALKLRSRPMTFEQVAEVLGRSKSSVVGRIKRMEAQGLCGKTRVRAAHRACTDPIEEDETDDIAAMVAAHLADLKATGRAGWCPIQNSM